MESTIMGYIRYRMGSQCCDKKNRFFSPGRAHECTARSGRSLTGRFYIACVTMAVFWRLIESHH